MTASIVLAQASCRVDLAGGTLDIWPLYLFHQNPVTVNFALDIFTQCEIKAHHGREITLVSTDTGRADRFESFAELRTARKCQHGLAVQLVRHFFPESGRDPEHGFTLQTNSMSPAGAGISGSSALMVATTAALAQYTGQMLEKEQIRQIAQNIEAKLINVPTGCQDYYPALYGGINAIHLEASGIRREALDVVPNDIERRFVVAYTGAPRQSGINNWEVFKAHIDGDKRVHRNFDQIAEIANGMRSALVGGDWTTVTRLLHDEWKLRKTNAPGITTPLIDRLIDVTHGKGAKAAKVCGAGGGGCVVFQVDPEARGEVSAAIEDEGAQVLPFAVAREGLTVVTKSATAATVS